MTSVSITREKILHVTRELWAEQGQIDLDQVDGTFYVHVCMADQIAEMERQARAGEVPNRTVNARIRQFLPNAPETSRYQYVIPERPCLRDAVDMSGSNLTRLTAGGLVVLAADGRTQDVEAGSVWIRLGIRNQEWNGTQVAREIVRRSRAGLDFYGKTFPHPPYPDNETIAIIGATLHKAGEYGQRVPDPDGSGWEFVPWPPMIVVAVAEPLPPEGVIAEYYDRMVIDQREWNEHLLGANNGQTIPIAIRTWATFLLVATGLNFGQAIGLLYGRAQAIDGDPVSQQRYGRDRELLLERVPEMKRTA